MTGWQAYLAAFWCIMCLISFIQMYTDKRRAIRGSRRIPERRLFFYALLGGAAGGWAGMRMFRHKTKHASFVYGLPLLAALQMGLIITVLVR